METGFSECIVRLNNDITILSKAVLKSQEDVKFIYNEITLLKSIARKQERINRAISVCLAGLLLWNISQIYR